MVLLITLYVKLPIFQLSLKGAYTLYLLVIILWLVEQLFSPAGEVIICIGCK